MVKGKDRIATMNSEMYGWHGNDHLHQVHKFDGQGAAALEFYVGSSWPDWKNPPGYQSTVGTTTQVRAVTEETGVLTVPLNLTGPVEVVIAPVGEDE
jgi:hypothetical protein